MKKIKNKGLIITAIIFFLIVNTTFFWGRNLGLWDMPVVLILYVIFLALGIALLSQIYFGIKVKRFDKNRLFTIAVLLFVLVSFYFKPSGIIDFGNVTGKDILVAQREGAANCMTTFRLKDDYSFVETNVCFGRTETKGKYHIQNDTIYFEQVELGRVEEEYYEFAIIKPSKLNNDGNQFDLFRYKNLNDTIGHELWITKNELNKLKNKT